MINRKKTINKIALSIMLITLCVMGLAFVVDSARPTNKQESVEAFYGKAIFGGQFAWMDNVKRPGLAGSKVGMTEPLNFDLNIQNAGIDISPNPRLDAQLIASIVEPVGSLGYRGPFDNEAGNGLVHFEQFMSPAIIDFDNGGSSSSLALNDPVNDNIITPGDEIIDEDDNEENNGNDDTAVVVPAPGAIGLAVIGIGAVLRIRRKS